MFLERLALRSLGKRNVNSRSVEAGMAEGFLDGLEVGATGNVVSSHGVPERVD